jgi:hypothetical protein
VGNVTCHTKDIGLFFSDEIIDLPVFQYHINNHRLIRRTSQGGQHFQFQRFNNHYMLKSNGFF